MECIITCWGIPLHPLIDLVQQNESRENKFSQWVKSDFLSFKIKYARCRF